MPSGRVLEPCRGGGAFAKALPGCDWCDLAAGRDFLAAKGRWDWIVSNPPYSQFRALVSETMGLKYSRLRGPGHEKRRLDLDFGDRTAPPQALGRRSARRIQLRRKRMPTTHNGPEIRAYANQLNRPHAVTKYQRARRLNRIAPTHSLRHVNARTPRTIQVGTR